MNDNLYGSHKYNVELKKPDIKYIFHYFIIIKNKNRYMNQYVQFRYKNSDYSLGMRRLQDGAHDTASNVVC